MSFLGEYVLSQGTWAGAGRAAALQMLALAQAGYVHIGLEEGKHAVRIIRTDKPDDELSHEEQFLLRAVFGAATVVILNRPHQKPVAQSALTIARTRLAKEGFIRALSPRALQRKLFWGYLFAVAAAAVSAGLAISPGAGIFVPCAALLVWMPYNVSIRRLLRSRNVFYKRKGRAAKRAATWHDARSAAAAETPTHVVEIMTTALSQRYAPRKKGYRRDNELWFEGLRGGHEQLADFGDSVRGNAASYDGSIDGDSGDGGGGDGGDSGDGGDGGGDG